MPEKEKLPDGPTIDPYEDLKNKIKEVQDPHEIGALMREGFRHIFSSDDLFGENSGFSHTYSGDFLLNLNWKLAERNILVNVLEKAIERTTGEKIRISDDSVYDLEIIQEGYNDPEVSSSKDLEKTILQEILRRDDGTIISWEDIEQYELILAYRKRMVK